MSVLFPTFILVRCRVVDTLGSVFHTIPANRVNLVTFYLPSPTCVTTVAGAVPGDLTTRGLLARGLGHT
jgi:hypothetical protein